MPQFAEVSPQSITCVDEAVTWSNIWEMLFNFKKCKHLHIGSRHDLVTCTMDSGQGVIETEKVRSEKDLGIIVDEALNFSEHISTKVSKANRNLGIIFRNLLTWIKKCSYLYNSIVWSHLEYAVTVCSPLYKKGYDRNRKRPEENHKFS